MSTLVCPAKEIIAFDIISRTPLVYNVLVVFVSGGDSARQGHHVVATDTTIGGSDNKGKMQASSMYFRRWNLHVGPAEMPLAPKKRHRTKATPRWLIAFPTCAIITTSMFPANPSSDQVAKARCNQRFFVVVVVGGHVLLFVTSTSFLFSASEQHERTRTDSTRRKFECVVAKAVNVTALRAILRYYRFIFISSSSHASHHQ